MQQLPKNLKEPMLLIAERFGKFYWRVLPGSLATTREPFGVCESWAKAKQAGDAYLAEFSFGHSITTNRARSMQAPNVSVGL